MTELRLAVLIGNGQFPSEPQLPPLHCPKHDVDGLQTVLRSEAHGQFTEVKTLVDQAHHAIKPQIQRALQQAGKEGLVLVYYSGHGRTNLQGQLYLATIDTKLDLLESTAVAVADIQILVRNSPCQKLLLILDCCYSGAAKSAFTKGDYKGQVNAALRASSRGVVILTATTALQLAEELPDVGYSLFTQHLIEGIASGNADRLEQGVISAADLKDYAARQLKKADKPQEPLLFGDDGNGLIVAKSVKQPKKERNENIKEMLFTMRAQKQLTDAVLTEALALLNARKPLNKTGRQRLGLIEQLYVKQLAPAEFIEQWLTKKSSPKLVWGALMFLILPVLTWVWPIVLSRIHHQESPETPIAAPLSDQQIQQAKTWLESDDQRNWPKAVSILSPLAQKRNIEAMYLLAGCYDFGLGVKKDHNLACRLYQSALKDGYPGDNKYYEEICP